MTTSCFGFCRDCKFWECSSFSKEEIKSYSYDKHPDDGWISAECKRIKRGISIECYSETVDYVSTDANFGCRFFEKS
jgi:hypothetical protein